MTQLKNKIRNCLPTTCCSLFHQVTTSTYWHILLHQLIQFMISFIRNSQLKFNPCAFFVSFYMYCPVVMHTDRQIKKRISVEWDVASWWFKSLTFRGQPYFLLSTQVAASHVWTGLTRTRWDGSHSSGIGMGAFFSTGVKKSTLVSPSNSY